MNARLRPGDYIDVGGHLWPVTTSLRQGDVVAALGQAGRTSAAIRHWTGTKWYPTGRALHLGQAAGTVGFSVAKERSIAAELLSIPPGHHGLVRGRYVERRHMGPLAFRLFLSADVDWLDLDEAVAALRRESGRQAAARRGSRRA